MNKFITLILVLLVNVTSVASAAEQVFFYHTDPVGTPLAMTNASGVVTWKADYKPFGEENSISGSAVNNKQFVGKEKDSETGLSYFGARYEDAKIGRFTAVDPVRAVDPGSSKTNEEMLLNPQRLNSYAYALNNPYKYFDILGLTADLILFSPLERAPNGVSLYKGATNVPSNPKIFQIASHGNSQKIYFNGNFYLAPAFRDYLLDSKNNTGYKKGTPIRLLGCNMGNGVNPFAQQLADVLNVRVEAANDYFAMQENGEYRVVAMKGHDKKGNYIPDNSNPGRMIPFEPRKSNN